MSDFTVTMNTVPITPNIQWCLGIDHLEFSESGNLNTYFYTDAKNQTTEELKRFTLALAEFVKNYR